MKITTILGAGALMLAAIPGMSTAQAPAKSAIVDSANKHLQRSGKPAKRAVNSQALVAQPNGKAKHTAMPPAITPTASTTSSVKAARVATSADSATKPAPAVQRAPITAKKKPPVH